MNLSKASFIELLKPRQWFRWLFVLALFVFLFGFGPEARQVMFGSLVDSYVQVTVFVALTLFIFYALESALKLDTATFLKKHKRWQIPLAALLGVLPGCGGAIMVMTQYSIGRLGFGSVIAVLTSTMGDAAFLLLATRPDTALLIFGVCFVVGTIFGWLVQQIHGYDFLRPQNTNTALSANKVFHYSGLKWPWVLVLVPGLVLGFLTAFQVEITNQILGVPIFETMGLLGAFLTMFMWFINPFNSPSITNRYESMGSKNVLDKVTMDTCFVTMWVVLAFLTFELTVHFTGWNLAGTFEKAKYFIPALAVLIGLIPGCGPQVLVTSLYLQGLVPLSAQIGNAISNDGDALFPAMAVSPKVSIIATLYTVLPALLVAYFFFFFID